MTSQPPAREDEDDIPTPHGSVAQSVPGEDGVLKPPTPISNELVWGSAGQRHATAELRELGPVVLRRIDDKVAYDCPPLDDRWHKVDIQDYDYAIPWTAELDKTASLETNAAKLRQLREQKKVNAQDPRLRAFDLSVIRLLQLVEGLHKDKDKWSIGLLHPHNILIAPGDKSPRVALVDLGFVSTAIVAPAWLQIDQPYVSLWRPSVAKSATDMAELLRQRQRAKGCDSERLATDLVVLARLLACVLTGTAGTPVGDWPTTAAVWDVLRRGEAGGFSSAADFRDALEAAPCSHHFRSDLVIITRTEPGPKIGTEVITRTETPPIPPKELVPQLLNGPPPPPPVQRRSKLWLVLVGVVVVSALAALGWVGQDLLRNGATNSSSQALGPTTNATTPLPDELEEMIRKAEMSHNRELGKVLVQIYQYPLADPRQQQERNRRVEAFRARYIAEWRTRFKGADVKDDPDDRLAAIKRLTPLRDELQQISTMFPESALRKEEQQCLDHCQLRIDQLPLQP